jgi:hypothetical protein
VHELSDAGSVLNSLVEDMLQAYRDFRRAGPTLHQPVEFRLDGRFGLLRKQYGSVSETLQAINDAMPAFKVMYSTDGLELRIIRVDHRLLPPKLHLKQGEAITA